MQRRKRDRRSVAKRGHGKARRKSAVRTDAADDAGEDVGPWFAGLTDVQLSMVFTLLANRQPLCCEDGQINVETITDDPVLQDRLGTHAYDGWGCVKAERTAKFLWTIQADNERLDRYFCDALDDVGFSNLGVVDGQDWREPPTEHGAPYWMN